MSHKDLWRNILVRLKPTIKLPQFKTWFTDTGILERDEESITVGLPTPFAKKWIQDKYNHKILQAAQEEDTNIKKIIYKINSALANEDSALKVSLSSILEEDDTKVVRKVRNKNEVHVGKRGLKSRKLSIQHTLDNFIVGKDNRLAHAACLAVSNMPGGIYNPLYVFSGVGLGKTHLLQATGREILKDNPDARVIYMTAEQFTNEIIEAIGSRRTKQFKDKYRTVDCFILDDIQFLENKDMSQMEFFHTFNDLYDANKQLILSSDSPPKDLNGFKERLKGRFGMGTVVEILPPDFETRLAILKQRCQDLQVIIDPDVLECIAFHVEENVRDLVGVLMQVISHSTLNEISPNIDLVSGILEKQHKIQTIHNKVSTNAQAKVTSIQQVIDTVAHFYNISKEEIVGPKRKKEIMMPRQICMYLIKRELDHSYEKIGEIFNNRNHSTVLHAYNMISKKLKTDPRLLRDVRAIKQDIGF
ncbi:chromosomal replication initiator protein DnaA [Patescibacteria group bacterium]